MTKEQLVRQALRRVKALKEGGKAAVVVQSLIDDMEGKIPAEVHQIPGPIGPQGERGERGEVGQSGNNGRNGSDGRDGFDGIDGAPGINGKDGSDGEKGDPGENGSPDTPKEIKEKLESLKGDDRLDASAIKNLPKPGKSLPVISLFGDHGGGQSTPSDPTTPINRTWDFTIIDPSGVYDEDTQIFVAVARDDLVITRIRVELDATTNQVAGDLKYADSFIGLANAVVVNDFDTTSGLRNDTSITSGSVASGKCIYLQFDSQPNAAINQMHVHIEWNFLTYQ